MNPHQMTRDFERAVCEYTGAPYCVAVNSCTSALMLAVAWHLRNEREFGSFEDGDMLWMRRRTEIEIPKRTYVGVPCAIIHGGGRPTFRDEDWLGAYQLKPLPVWDSARWFTSRIYEKLTLRPIPTDPFRMMIGGMVCVSFHWTKTLGVEFDQGGAILHDSAEADAWLRRARFDGRTEGVAPKDDNFTMAGWHCYMNPTTAQRLHKMMQLLSPDNAPLPNDDYPDLSLHEAFK